MRAGVIAAAGVLVLLLVLVAVVLRRNQRDLHELEEGELRTPLDEEAGPEPPASG